MKSKIVRFVNWILGRRRLIENESRYLTLNIELLSVNKLMIDEISNKTHTNNSLSEAVVIAANKVEHLLDEVRSLERDNKILKLRIDVRS